MTDDDRPAERRTFPSTAVLEWRVTKLEEQAVETQRLMVENKNEILRTIRESSTRSGIVYERVIQGVTVLAAVAAAFFAAHK